MLLKAWNYEKLDTEKSEKQRERRWEEWKTEREEVMRRVRLCETKRWWVTERKKPTYWESRWKMQFFTLCCCRRRTSVEMKSSEWEREVALQCFAQEEVDLQVAEEEADLQVVKGTNHEELGLGLGFSPNLFSLFPLQPSMCLWGYKVFNGKLFLFFLLATSTNQRLIL